MQKLAVTLARPGYLTVPEIDDVLLLLLIYGLLCVEFVNYCNKKNASVWTQAELQNVLRNCIKTALKVIFP